MPAPTDSEGDPSEASTTGSPTPPSAVTADVGRRTFFRRFAGELVQTAASLTGAAAVAQGAVVGASAAAQELAAGPGATPPAASAPSAGPTLDQLARRHLSGRVVPWARE